MSKIKVACEVPVYEVEGDDDSDVTDKVVVTVKSHWNMSDRVVLVISNEGKEVTVIGKHLVEAIENAMRTGE